ncbi:MAG TPA: YdeI/OmpD-associated family protein [Candidatus Angelobacter sp.]
MAASFSAVKAFEAVLERSGDRLNWTIIRIPFDAVKLWGKRGQLRVKGEVNGFAFRSALFPTGNGSHVLMVNKKMQAGGKVTPGAKAKFRLEPDAEPREIKSSAELTRMLRQSKQLQKFYDSLNFSTRRYIALWVDEGKHVETRRRRAEQLAERMMETMEAERELPPLIQLAMQRNPKARAGWELMSKTHRRSHLLGIFYYRNPEARARRLAKAVEEMVEYAEKRKTGSGGDERTE